MRTLTEAGAFNDIAIDGDGLISVSVGKKAYAEIIASMVRTLLGEIQLDPSIGIDYMGTVFRSVSRISVWKHFVKTALERLPFVTGVLSFDASYKPASRTMEYVLKVSTDGGLVEVSQ